MFKYEYEKPSCSRSGERARAEPSRAQASVERARRPLPPRPISERLPTKPTVPVRVWLVSGASCLAVSAALVLATLAITRWTADRDYTTELYSPPEPVNAKHSTTQKPLNEIDTDLTDLAILEKLSLFKNIVANRERTKDLLNQPQFHPLHEPYNHPEKHIEKKDKPKALETLKLDLSTNEGKIQELVLPEFKPLLPLKDIKLPESYLNNLYNKDYEDYYNDINLYDDYMESNTMTSYLIEKVQELHDWITKDPDFEINNGTAKADSKNDFGQVLKALNESLLEGNVSIVMNKLRDIYFGDNYTSWNNSKRVILTNSTDLVSFGILTLDVLLLHNIQMMAWENQEGIRSKMLKDPDVFAFNALFMEPSKLEAKSTEAHSSPGRVHSVPGGLWERAVEGAMGAARAALHLGRAYKNARNILSQLSSKEPITVPQSLSRQTDSAQALHNLQSLSDRDNMTSSGVSFTELDCVWLLYCRALVASARLPPPYGAMARINGMGLRMIAGVLSAERALDALLFEALGAGAAPLHCDTMLPKCSKADAASIVLQAILQTQKKSTNRGR